MAVLYAVNMKFIIRLINVSKKCSSSNKYTLLHFYEEINNVKFKKFSLSKLNIYLGLQCHDCTIVIKQTFMYLEASVIISAYKTSCNECTEKIKQNQ